MPTFPRPSLFRFLALLLLLLPPPHAVAQDLPGDGKMFPPAPAARKFVNFDGRGFIVNGRRTFIVAGDLHYSRVPRALWHDRLLRLKRMGCNTVQTYTFWSFHERREGKFDFSGDRDLDAFLKEIRSLGMYASVRVGPYVNAEWGGGGWPVWLRFKPGVRVREDNPQFYKYMDRWLGKLMPIVAANQINRGGPVILVQMENEDPRGTGTVMAGNPYFQHLKDKCVALGMQVPSFFSGLHHSDNPAGEQPFDDSAQGSPWLSTEFWTGWFGVYGSEERAQARTRATWNILANGGAGYDHYTGAGGTNFETWGSDQTGASYDFGAPVGQVGDIRDFFYMLKRPALFAASFPKVLANSRNSSGEYAGAATGGAGVSARTSPAGTIVFLKNNGDAPLKTQFKDKNGKLHPSAGPVTLAPQEIMPVVLGYPLIPGVKMDCAARVLSVVPQGDVTTLVVYGAPGDPAEIQFSVTAKDAPIVKSPTLTASPGRVVFQTKFPASKPQSSEFKIGAKTVRVLAVSSDMADRTWPLTVGGQTLIICGLDYVGDVAMQNGRLAVQAEQRTAHKVGQQSAFWLVGPGPMQPLVETAASKAAHGAGRVPTLAAWRTAPGDAEAKSQYNDAAWKKSDAPLQMGADGDDGALAWYRATVHAPAAGPYGLNFADAGDWLTTWVNGVHGAGSTVEQRFRTPVPRAVQVNLKAGDNLLSVLTAHYGRQKLHAYLGPINDIDAKGLHGPVTLVQTAGGSAGITAWRWKADARGLASAGEMAAPGLNTKAAGWQSVGVGPDVFGGKAGFAWFRAKLPDVPGVRRRLHFEHVDDTGFVYVNGVKVGENIDNGNPFDVNIDSVWKAGGPNTLAVLVQNTNGGGGLAGPVSLLGEAGGGGEALKGWKMRGGITLPDESAAVWRASSKATPTGAPAFFQAHFAPTPPGAVGPHPTLRASYAGLSRGFFWLNGHNLGRYPERSPIESLYLPECWLKSGQNTLAVFDEEGRSPARVRIVEETTAGRQGVALTAPPAAR